MPTTDNNQTITMNPRREIDDLIGNPPGCLLKSGITIVALVIVTILTMSAFISYPDKIVAIGEMTGDYPPIEHVNKVAGVIDKIYVKDGESVQWEEQHYILAEVSGKIVLQPNITQDIFAKPNTPLFSIISDKQQDKKYAKVITPVQGIGKITEGDKALLKLEGYPYKEYGVIISEVYHIAPLPNKDQEGNKYYELKISLSDTLMTNYKKIIEYKPQSALTAEIITKDKSILERITEQLLDLITEK